MAHYVLVHGAWHGAWCWEKIAPLLKAKGHSVVAPDLPGHGKDKTPFKEITFKHYTDCIEAHLKEAGEVILVGHSMAGMVISQVAERHPEKVKSLVYVAGYLPQNGESLYDIASHSPVTRFVKMMKVDIENNAFYFPAYAMKDFAYQQCSAAVFERILPLFCDEPLSPFTTPVSLSSRFTTVPKVYIECLQDNAISIETQRQMQKTTPCTIYTLDCDHSPFYSAPSALTDLLHKI